MSRALALGVLLAAGTSTAAPRFAEVQPLLAKYCHDCHGDGSSRGDVTLDEFPSHAARVAATKLWSRVHDNVRNELMPPPKQPQPTAAERALITAWIDAEVLRVDCAAPDPGRVTARRLNRQEYTNTVRDLLGVSFNAGEEFPPDDAGYGFDNIGDVLSVSPLLMEKYFDAAEAIARRAVVVGRPPPPRRAWTARDLTTVEGTPPGLVVREARFALEHDGVYDLSVEVRVGSFDPFSGAAKFSAALDGRELLRKRYHGHDRTFRHQLVRRLGKGEHVLRLTFDQREVKTAKPGGRIGFDAPETAVVGPRGAVQYPESHQRVLFRGPAPADAEGRRRYTREILEQLAGRAFRRPVQPVTLDRLTELATAAAERSRSFEAGVVEGLRAILVAPQFLFRTEAQPRPDDPAVVHPLDEHALASRLSYWLWTSAPDDELLRLADAGRLRAELHAQVERMLRDGRAERFVGDFVGQWLQTRDVEGVFINNFRYPALTDAIRRSMKRETEQLFAYLMREDRDIIELLTARYTFVDGPLAAYYGIEGVSGPQARKVDLPADGPRGGILTHGSFLVVTSNPTRTSPVKRGLFVLDNLLGVPPPPPPPNVPDLEDARKDGRRPSTTREQLAIHRENAACASCHARMDPIGLGLENFDLIGRWRDTEGDQPIDARGELTTGEKFTGVAELRAILATRRTLFYRTVVSKLMTYALGRGLDPADRCTIDAIATRMLAGGGRFRTALLGIVDSPAFQSRRGHRAGVASNPPETQR